MATLLTLIDRFQQENPVGVIVDADSLLACAISAINYYVGYTDLLSLDVTPRPEVNDGTEVTDSEWAIIRPLFRLYVERQSAVAMEMSRIVGADMFGRPSDSVTTDINQCEADLPRKAFYMPITSI